MNGVKKNVKETKVENSLKKLINLYNRCELNQLESIDVLSSFLYSVGTAILKKKNITTEKLLKEYATNPTFGSALMLQALHMKETWSRNLEKE